MVLNYIWIAFFLVAFAVALVRLIFMGDTEVFPAIMNSTFSSAKSAFEISLGLTGVLSLWLGVMKIGEKGGVVDVLARWLSPVFCKLFPEVPKGHPVVGNIFMNISANMLGLDNAATPLGLKAMERLQDLNEKKDTATNSMIMFLVINTSGLTIIPVSIMVYRAQMGAANPTDIFVPILLATFVSTLAGIIVTSLYQRINLFNRTLLLFLGALCTLVALIIWGFSAMPREQMDVVSSTFANVSLTGEMELNITGDLISELIQRDCKYVAITFAPSVTWSTDTVTITGASFGNGQPAGGVVINNGTIYVSVPEPTTATLSLLALAGLAARRRRK